MGVSFVQNVQFWGTDGTYTLRIFLRNQISDCMKETNLNIDKSEAWYTAIHDLCNPQLISQIPVL